MKEYNKKRIIWAEVIIGMRETLTSERKPVAMTEKTRHNYRL